ncbi:MAG: alpha/beta fold hydrolase [Candidatus Solibacter sp.]
MMAAMCDAGRIDFPPFHLDLSGGRLGRGAEFVDLAPKALGVLQYLAERPGHLVTKEELLGAIWPDVFVTADVLKVTVAEIRRVLGDSHKDPRFIETAHRRGYRFVAAVGKAAGELSAFEPGHSPALEIPCTHYARSGDVNIAYQVLGEGPIDLVFVMGWVSHLDYFWTEPSFARFLRRLAGFSRLILFDKRGTGLSDRVPVGALPTLEQRMDDVRAVMDAVGSKRAVLCGVSEGGAMSALFAATYPHRTAALVMIGSYAKRICDASYPWGPTMVQREEFLRVIQEDWGGPVGIETRAPSMVNNPQFREWWAAYLRTSASPAAAVALTRMNSEADIRDVLPAIRVPTLVLHRAGDQCLVAEEGRYIASRIPEARYVELHGDDHLPFVGDQDEVIDEVEEFLTGVRHTRGPDPILATLLSATFEVPREAWALHRLRDHVLRELQWFHGRECGGFPHNLCAYFDGPARAVRCASAIAHHAVRLGIAVKAGLHIGECEVTIAGVQGTAVERAKRIREQAEPGQVLVSTTIRDLVAGSGIRFRPAGNLAGGCAADPIALLMVDNGVGIAGPAAVASAPAGLKIAI